MTNNGDNAVNPAPGAPAPTTTPANLYRWQRRFTVAKGLLVKGDYNVGEAMVAVYDPNHPEVVDSFAEALLLVEKSRPTLAQELRALILTSRSTHFGSSEDDHVPAWHSRNAQTFLAKVLLTLCDKMLGKQMKVAQASKVFDAYFQMFRGWSPSIPGFADNWSLAHAMVVTLESQRDCFVYESVVTRLTLYKALFIDRLALMIQADRSKRDALTWDNAFGYICGSDALTAIFKRAATQYDASACYNAIFAARLLAEIEAAKSELTNRIGGLHQSRPSFVKADGSKMEARPKGEWDSCPKTWDARVRGLLMSDLFLPTTAKMQQRMGCKSDSVEGSWAVALPADDDGAGVVEEQGERLRLLHDHDYLYERLMPDAPKPFCIRRSRTTNGNRERRAAHPYERQSSVSSESSGAETSVEAIPTRASSPSPTSSPSSKPASPPHMFLPEMQLTPPREGKR